jgi:hypothetical protein
MICFAGRRLAVLATPPRTYLLTWSGRRDSNPRSRRWQRRVLATRRLPHWSEQRELNSRHRVGGPRHQPLYHARPSHLAGVTGFEPAGTHFGDERPSHRVITPVAVATGVEPVPPHRQSGILPLDSATTFQTWLRGHDSNVHEPGQSRLSWPI